MTIESDEMMMRGPLEAWQLSAGLLESYHTSNTSTCGHLRAPAGACGQLRAPYGHQPTPIKMAIPEIALDLAGLPLITHSFLQEHLYPPIPYWLKLDLFFLY